MQLSKKSEYAVRAISILAAAGIDRSLQANEMAAAGDIPQKFLEQILLVLKRSGLVISKRGVGGGYRIAREPRLITVAGVILSVEGEDLPMPGIDEAGTFPGAAGLVHCFTAASAAYWATLEKTTIDDLLNHQSGDAMVGYGI
jgi:Rrf2 family protein